MTTETKNYRARVWSMNHTDGWEEFNDLDAVKAWLYEQEKLCRTLAQQYADLNPDEFTVRNPETDKREPMTDEQIEDWICDRRDSNGNKPQRDVAVFCYDVEEGIIDEDGDIDWEDVTDSYL